MNPSTAHLPQKPSSRAIGLAFVAAVHVVAFIAFSQGLMIKLSPKPVEPTVVKTIDTPPPPPEPIKKVQADQPKLPVWNPLPVPIPDDPPIAPPPTSTVYAEHREAIPQDASPRGPVAAPAQAKPTDGIQPFGAVCTRTQAPESPSVNWTGEALFSVVAGTHAGRVNQIEIRLLRGAMDGRTQRAFKSAIESALREGYQCPGDVRFSQEFQFRVE